MPDFDQNKGKEAKKSQRSLAQVIMYLVVVIFFIFIWVMYERTVGNVKEILSGLFLALA